MSSPRQPHDILNSNPNCFHGQPPKPCAPQIVNSVSSPTTIRFNLPHTSDDDETSKLHGHREAKRDFVENCRLSDPYEPRVHQPLAQRSTFPSYSPPPPHHPPEERYRPSPRRSVSNDISSHEKPRDRRRNDEEESSVVKCVDSVFHVSGRLTRSFLCGCFPQCSGLMMCLSIFVLILVVSALFLLRLPLVIQSMDKLIEYKRLEVERTKITADKEIRQQELQNEAMASSEKAGLQMKHKERLAQQETVERLMNKFIDGNTETIQSTSGWIWTQTRKETRTRFSEEDLRYFHGLLHQYYSPNSYAAQISNGEEKPHLPTGQTNSQSEFVSWCGKDVCKLFDPEKDENGSKRDNDDGDDSSEYEDDEKGMTHIDL